MTKLALTLVLIACMVPPALGQEIIFEDDFEVDTGFWLSDWGIPVDQRSVDPLDQMNQVIRPPKNFWAFGSADRPIDSCSIPIPVDMASTYVLSFRFLDESPEYQYGHVYLSDDPIEGVWYSMPFELIADGSWHEYLFEFTPGELFDPGSENITIVLGAPCWTYGDFPQMCDGETWNYYDNFIIERTEVVPSEALNWGRVKALFR